MQLVVAASALITTIVDTAHSALDAIPPQTLAKRALAADLPVVLMLIVIKAAYATCALISRVASRVTQSALKWKTATAPSLAVVSAKTGIVFLESSVVPAVCMTAIVQTLASAHRVLTENVRPPPPVALRALTAPNAATASALLASGGNVPLLSAVPHAHKPQTAPKQATAPRAHWASAPSRLVGQTATAMETVH